MGLHIEPACNDRNPQDHLAAKCDQMIILIDFKCARNVACAKKNHFCTDVRNNSVPKLHHAQVASNAWKNIPGIPGMFY